MKRRPSRAQAGLTLIELMIAVVVSTVVVAFLLGVHTRMSVAYHSQTGVSSVLQTLRAGRQLLQRDLRMAGFMIPGQTVSVSTTLDPGGAWQVLAITNDADGAGPDSFRVVYTDPAVTTAVSGVDLANHTVDVADAAGFPAGTPIVLIAASSACVAAVTGVIGSSLFIDPSAGSVYNQAPDNPQCDAVAAQVGAGVVGSAHPLVAATYRIDPDRRAVAVLQRSPSGGVVAGDWEDLGIGFTNLQLASRYFEPGDTTDRDGDGDGEHDWYSSENQETPDATGTRAAGGSLTDVSLSIEVRSDDSVDTVGSSATPAFTVVGRTEHNRLGDWGGPCPANQVTDPCGLDLANMPDDQRPERYRGVHIYRWSTTLIDLRNIGVGL